jgi:UDP-N-acetylmuramate dehydrogenase
MPDSASFQPANLREHVDLQACNTLALPARARYFLRATAALELADAIAWARARQLPLLVLGGGSNVVLRGDWPGLVLQIAIEGRRIDIDSADSDSVRVTVGAGENWHALVQWSLQQQLYGLENLTLIPGTVGAAPIQNIGAYGVELQSRLECVRGFELPEAAASFDEPFTAPFTADNAWVELSAAQCRLGYRDSIFKHALRGRFVIVEVVLRLARTFAPVLDYPPLNTLQMPDAALVERTVRELRQSKLPDPVALPNVGSFFKNPVVDAAHFAALAKQHPDIPCYPAPAGVKLPAAWLVDRCGWKGRRQGSVGVHDRQALVLVNYAGAAAAGDVAGELLALAAAIQADVLRIFDVQLELEPTVYGELRDDSPR